MTAVYPISGRCQSRGFQTCDGVLYGVAASKGFDEPSIVGGITEHSKAAFRRIDELLDAVNLHRRDICFVTVYLDDVLKDVDAFNAEWRNYFSGHAPARCCVGAKLQSGILVEMTFTAQSQDQLQISP